jgi:hypothetical protein
MATITARSVRIATIAATAAVLAGGCSAQARDLASVTKTPPWQVARMQIGAQFVHLTGVAAISARDVWAVGESGGGGVIAHWNGTAWSRVHAPFLGGGGRLLADVAGTSARNVWAVGQTGPPNRPLLVHWNGKSWTQAKIPHIAGHALLSTISADSVRDAWALGSVTTGSVEQQLILHWDGSQWRRAAVPAGDDFLDGISALSPDNVWAVGSRATTGRATRPVIVHWNGAAWATVPGPDPSPGNDQLRAVLALSASDAWATGITKLRDGHFAGLFEHWNGARWRVVRYPATPGDRFTALAGTSARNVWAVAWNGFTARCTIVHWAGSAWAKTRVPANPACLLSGVTVAPDGRAWAVGSYGDPGSGALILRWFGAPWD